MLIYLGLAGKKHFFEVNPFITSARCFIYSLAEWITKALIQLKKI
jgi:hypothetical protein